MTAQTTTPEHTSRRSITGGLILIGLGLAFLAGQFIQQAWYGQLLLAGLGTAFLAAGLWQRNSGLLIPGGILAGLGAGVAAQAVMVDASPTARGGVFLLCFAAGWALISLLSLVVSRRMLWPLIPGAILALVGAALMAGGQALEVLRWLGAYGWPVILILVGLALILRRRDN